MVVTFDNKPKLVKAEQVINEVSNELYQKYFVAWIAYKHNCYDEALGNISVYCSIMVSKNKNKTRYEMIIEFFFLLKRLGIFTFKY